MKQKASSLKRLIWWLNKNGPEESGTIGDVALLE